jgi:hypothetical protein
MKTPKEISIQNRRPGGWDDYFYVRGGPFAHEQIMGWHITDEDGHTLAVSPSQTFGQFCVEAVELCRLLKKAHAKSRLSECREEGYMDDVSAKDWERLEELLG